MDMATSLILVGNFGLTGDVLISWRGVGWAGGDS